MLVYHHWQLHIFVWNHILVNVSWTSKKINIQTEGLVTKTSNIFSFPCTFCENMVLCTYCLLFFGFAMNLHFLKSCSIKWIVKSTFGLIFIIRPFVKWFLGPDVISSKWKKSYSQFLYALSDLTFYKNPMRYYTQKIFKWKKNL